MKSPTSAHAISYRADIDGLRAVAVLAVVAFHAFPQRLPGGFVGVDVFFVISGYLISSLLYKDLERGSLSIARFYDRRIRRIFPSLAVVMLCSLVAGWWILDADEYRLLGKHVLASAVFLQNVALYREVGYFDAAASTKPLLHLWSLSVEEQFYLVWPFVLAWSWRRRLVAPALGVTAVLSLAASVITAHTAPAAGFYLPFTRLWELLVGGALAYWVLRAPASVTRRPNATALAGAALLVLAFALIDDTSPFPGAWALLPVMGAALLIAAGPAAFVNRHILSHPVAVWIGLISYPLYLWHWVLLTFALLAFGTLTVPLTLVAVAGSFALAAVTYATVERRLRFTPSRWPLVALPTALVGLAAVGTWVLARQGVATRPIAERLAAFKWDPEPRGLKPCDDPALTRGVSLEYCLVRSTGPTDAVVLGDSHAADKFPGIALVDSTRTWGLVGHPSCPPVYGVHVEGDIAGCEQRSERAIDWIVAQPTIRTVVLAFLGSYAETTNYAADHVRRSNGPREVVVAARGAEGQSKGELFHRGLAESVRRLGAAGKDVVVLIDVPELPFIPKECVRDARECYVPRADVLARQARQRAIVARLQAEYPRVRVFDPLSLSCDATRCSLRSGGSVYYRDSHHLSMGGSTIFSRAFLRWLDAPA